MASLGTLTLDLVAKVGGFTGALDKAGRSSDKNSKKIARNQERVRKQMKESIKTAAKWGAGIAAVSGAAVVAFTKMSFAAADTIGKVAATAGVSTDALQEMRHAATLSGISFNDLDKGMQSFNKRIGELKAGTGALYTYLSKTDEELLNQLKTTEKTEDALDLMFEAMKNVTNESQRAALAASAFGRSGQRLVILTDEYENLRKEARDLGLVIDKDLIKNAEKANDKLSTLTRIIQTQLTSAVLEAAPAIQKLAQSLIDLAPGLRWLLGGEEANAKKLNQLEEIGEKIRFLADEQNNLNNIIIRQQQLQAKGSPLFDAAELENTRMLYAAIGEEIKALAKGSSELSGGGNQAETGTRKATGVIGISNEQIKNLESYYKGWQEYDQDATKNIYENKQKLLDNEMSIIDESLEYIKWAADEEKKIDKELSDYKMQLIQEEKALRLSAIMVAGDSFAYMAQLAKEYGNEQTVLYKSLFAASKAFTIAEATLNMFQAISEAGTLPFPANLGAMALVGAQMSTIISSAMAVGMAHDGINSVPETGTWLLKKGERVTTAETSQKLDNTLSRIQTGSNYQNESSAQIGTSQPKEDHYHYHNDGPTFLNRSQMRDVSRILIKEIDRERTRIGAVV